MGAVTCWCILVKLSGESKLYVVCSISILISLNPAWINNCFRASAFAKAKGPGAAGGGVGAFICFLTVAKAKSSNGTLEGTDHTAAESLPFVVNICLTLTKAAGRFGRNIRPHLVRYSCKPDGGIFCNNAF